MDMRELTIMPREGLGKGEAKRLRRAGRTPGILYGGATPVTIAVDPRDVFRIIHGREGSTQLLKLTFAGSADSKMAILRDMQFDQVLGDRIELHVTQDGHLGVRGAGKGQLEQLGAALAAVNDSEDVPRVDGDGHGGGAAVEDARGPAGAAESLRLALAQPLAGHDGQFTHVHGTNAPSLNELDEEGRDRLLVVDATDGLRQERGHRQHVDLG